MMTNEEINKLAGAVLGYCNHDWSDDVYAEYYEVGKCVHCEAEANDDEDVPDFCNDLNEAQRLVKHTINATDYGNARKCDHRVEGFK